MKFQMISSQQQLKFLQTIDWDDAFVKEIYTISPTYVASGIVAHGNRPDVRLLLIAPNDLRTQGIEFKFRSVYKIQFSFSFGVHPWAIVSKINTSLMFGVRAGEVAIRAEQGFYKTHSEMTGQYPTYSEEYLLE